MLKTLYPHKGEYKVRLVIIVRDRREWIGNADGKGAGADAKLSALEWAYSHELQSISANADHLWLKCQLMYSWLPYNRPF